MNIEAKHILSHVCSALKVNEKLIVSNTRKNEVIDARYITIYLIREKLPHVTLRQLGEWFYPNSTKCPHTSTLYAVRKVKEWVSISKFFEAKLQLCKKELMTCELDFDNIPQY